MDPSDLSANLCDLVEKGEEGRIGNNESPTTSPEEDSAIEISLDPTQITIENHKQLMLPYFSQIQTVAENHLREVLLKITSEHAIAVAQKETENAARISLEREKSEKLSRKIEQLEQLIKMERLAALVRLETFQERVADTFLVEKMKRIVLPIFHTWRVSVVEAMALKKLEKMVDIKYKRSVKSKVFSVLARSHIKRKCERERKQVIARLDTAAKQTIGGYASEAHDLKRQLETAQEIARTEHARRCQLEEDVKRMLLKNMTSMNFEAMAVFQHSLIPPPMFPYEGESEGEGDQTARLRGDGEHRPNPEQSQNTPPNAHHAFNDSNVGQQGLYPQSHSQSSPHQEHQKTTRGHLGAQPIHQQQPQQQQQQCPRRLDEPGMWTALGPVVRGGDGEPFSRRPAPVPDRKPSQQGQGSGLGPSEVSNVQPITRSTVPSVGGGVGTEVRRVATSGTGAGAGAGAGSLLDSDEFPRHRLPVPVSETHTSALQPQPQQRGSDRSLPLAPGTHLNIFHLPGPQSSASMNRGGAGVSARVKPGGPSGGGGTRGGRS